MSREAAWERKRIVEIAIFAAQLPSTTEAVETMSHVQQDYIWLSLRLSRWEQTQNDLALGTVLLAYPKIVKADSYIVFRRIRALKNFV